MNAWKTNDPIIVLAETQSLSLDSSLTRSLFFLGIQHLIESTIADEPPMRDGQIWAFGNDGLLNFHDLGNVI